MAQPYPALRPTGNGPVSYYNVAGSRNPLSSDMGSVKHEKSGTIHDGSTKGMKLLFDSTFSEAKIEEIINSLTQLSNVESVSMDKETNLCTLTLTVAESDKKTSGEIGKIEGVKIIEKFSGEIVNTFEYEAKIMENGLVIQEYFFEKVSD